ncbi:MAG: ComEA family DNA-binding protein, partial [Bacteroidota bacterium]
MKYVLAILFFIVFCASGWSQEDLTRQTILEQRLEIIQGALEEGEEFDYTDLLDDLTYFLEHPLNLNHATESDLQSLYLLSDLQIRNLRAHIERYGPLLSLYELQAVQGFDMETIRNVQPFVTASPTGAFSGLTWSDVLRQGTSDLFLRYRRTLEQQQGYKLREDGTTPFAGSPDYVYA